MSYVDKSDTDLILELLKYQEGYDLYMRGVSNILVGIWLKYKHGFSQHSAEYVDIALKEVDKLTDLSKQNYEDLTYDPHLIKEVTDRIKGMQNE